MPSLESPTPFCFPCIQWTGYPASTGNGGEGSSWPTWTPLSSWKHRSGMAWEKVYLLALIQGSDTVESLFWSPLLYPCSPCCRYIDISIYIYFFFNFPKQLNICSLSLLSSRNHCSCCPWSCVLGKIFQAKNLAVTGILIAFYRFFFFFPRVYGHLQRTMKALKKTESDLLKYQHP